MEANGPRGINVHRPQTKLIRVIQVPMRIPASLGEMEAAIARAKELGASSGTTSWLIQANHPEPGMQSLVVNEDQSVPVEIVRG